MESVQNSEIGSERFHTPWVAPTGSRSGAKKLEHHLYILARQTVRHTVMRAHTNEVRKSKSSVKRKAATSPTAETTEAITEAVAKKIKKIRRSRSTNHRDTIYMRTIHEYYYMNHRSLCNDAGLVDVETIRKLCHDSETTGEMAFNFKLFIMIREKIPKLIY